MSAEFEPGEQSSHCDIICPHCGWSYQAEPCDGDASEDPSEHECDDCGKPFILYASISITYHTKAKEAKLCRYCLRSDCECSDSDVMPDIGDK